MNEKYKSTIFLFSKLKPKLPSQFSIITAFNPMDQLLDKNENLKNNIYLYDEIKKFTNLIIPVIGCSPDFDHKEDSFLSDTSLTESVTLGNKFNQRAVFYVKRNELSIIDCCTLKELFIGKFNDRVIFKK